MASPEKRTLKEMFEDYAPSMVSIEVKNTQGEWRIGSGFHIGRGLIATARHVLGSRGQPRLVQIANTKPLEIRDTWFHEDETVDLAVVVTNFSLEHYLTKVTYPTDARRNAAKTDHIPLGFHLNDWLGNEFVLSKVLLLGYPPIPTTRDAVLVAATAEVNALVDKRGVLHPYLVISGMPRGGFSGGPVISEYGFLLGVYTESMVRNEQVAELGFGAALTIEPLLELLAAHGTRPVSIEAELWNQFFG